MGKKVGAAGKMMKKAVEKIIITDKLKTYIPASTALPGPPLGPLLGQRGINITAFCKDFNNRTSTIKEGVPLPCVISVNPDRSYDLKINNPPSMYYLFQAAGIQRGAMQPGKEEAVGKITIKHIYEIAKLKQQDYHLQLRPLKQICESLIGAAHCMGLEVVRDLNADEYGEYLRAQQERIEQQLVEIEEKKEAKLLRK